MSPEGPLSAAGSSGRVESTRARTKRARAVAEAARTNARSSLRAHDLAHWLLVERKSPLLGEIAAIRIAERDSKHEAIRTSLSRVAALDETTRSARFARNVKLARALADMTQETLARRLEMKRVNVSRMEHGSEPRDQQRLVRLAEIFELPDWSWFYEAHPELEALLTDEQKKRVGLR